MWTGLCAGGARLSSGHSSPSTIDPPASRLTIPPYTPAPTTSIGRFQPIRRAVEYGIGSLFQDMSVLDRLIRPASIQRGVGERVSVVECNVVRNCVLRKYHRWLHTYPCDQRQSTDEALDEALDEGLPSHAVLVLARFATPEERVHVGSLRTVSPTEC